MFKFSGRTTDCYPFLSVYTSYRTHLPCTQMNTGGSFPTGKAVGVKKLKAHILLVPRLIMQGAIPPLSYMLP
jgi:ABC-type uncharacterized transport system permease subunit